MMPPSINSMVTYDTLHFFRNSSLSGVNILMKESLFPTSLHERKLLKISILSSLRLRNTPRPLTSKLKWLPEKNTRRIALVGLAEYSAAYPVRAKTALRLQQRRWLDALP